MKKTLSMLLALSMLIGLLTTTVLAETKYTLTLDNAQAEHTYTAYQIFAGDLNDSTLSNIEWGSGVTGEGKTALGNAAAKAESLKTTEDAEAFAVVVAQYLGTAAGSATVEAGATTCKIPNLEAGYYLIKTTGVSATNDVYTYYIMKIVKDTTATVKADVPKIEKTVDDNDANIGDTVTFTLTATMPSNIQGYEKYKMVFHDTMSAGLTFVESSVTVTIDSADKTEAFKVEEKNGELTVSCDNVLAQNAKESVKVVVTYKAIVDEDAVIGTEGNPNKVYLEYSNNPNWNGEGDEPTGNTPEVEVKVYTWEIPVFKYTGEAKTALAGAGFTLYKDDVAVQVVNAENNIYKVCTKDNCTDHTHITQIVTDGTGRFEVEGLEQGTYTLKETTTPAGYNTCEDITVVIGENGAIKVGKNDAGEDIIVTEVEIENKSGSILPETGGIGTTIFYVLGGLMAVGAGVLLVAKKRMDA